MFAKKFLYGALTLLVIALGFGLTTQVHAQSDPITIVKGFYDAVNAQNLEQAASYYADTFIGISPGGRFIGKVKATEGLAGAIKDGIKFELSDFKNDNGRVVYTYKVIMGNDVVDSGDNGLTIVRDGKIVFDGITDTEKDWPIAVFEGYYAAYNAGDIDLAVEYLADDVVFSNPTGTYIGKPKARENLEAIKKDGLTFEVFDLKNDNGRIVNSYKVIIGGETVETGEGGLTIVKNGLIVFDGTLETEQQLPKTGADSPLRALWWAVLSGMILLALGGLLLKRKIA